MTDPDYELMRQHEKEIADSIIENIRYIFEDSYLPDDAFFKPQAE